MPLARAWSVALFGVDGVAVEIEADIGGGRPRTQIVGLPDASLNEAKERVRAAIRNSQRGVARASCVTLALSPAALPERAAPATTWPWPAPSWPRPIACPASCSRASSSSANWRWTAGSARSAACSRACWPPAARASAEPWCPPPSLSEAALVTDLDVRGASTLLEVLSWLRGEQSTLVRPARRHCPAPPR